MRYEPLDHVADGRRLIGAWVAVGVVLMVAFGGTLLEAGAGPVTPQRAAHASHAGAARAPGEASCG